MPYIKKILIFLTLILITGCKSNNLSPKDDYYDYINKKDITNTKLNDDEFIKSTFTIAQDKTDKQANTIIKDLIKENKDMSIIYNNLLNIKDNITTLKPYLNKIDNSHNIKEYINNAIDIENDLNIDIFTNITIDKDFKDTSKNIIYLEPITYDFGTSSDYYANPDYMSYKALIKQYGLKLLKEYGYDTKKARSISTNITNMYTDIASNSKISKDLEDISNYYNIITIEDLQKIYPNININNYLNNKNIPNNTKFSIIDINNYKEINKYLTNDNLPILKEALKLKILENYAPYLSNKYASIVYELNDKISGTTNNKTKEEHALDTTKAIFTNSLDKSYQDKYLTKEKYNYINNLITDIKEFYYKDINSLSWLSSKTKNQARKKIKHLTINIGNDYYNITNYNLNTNSNIIDNIITISNIEKKQEIERLTNNKNVSKLSQTTVNAYYNPSNNSINFPTASLNLIDTNDNYYQTLGSIGMIIAHEITHAFDDNGSKFDELGNMNNWWTTKDRTNFNRLKKKTINYYNKYEVLDGTHINGKKTVNENIADLGAISCITNLALSKKATSKDLKEMYKSLAKLWFEKTNKEYQKLLLLQDTHSPAKYRVNATLSSTEEFYKIYNINIFNKMYIPQNKRIKIW
ncbi:MAG: M13 family metallopeptidase [Bacilli bacterium]|nr:M13 family metallopeptidase [Bacilli bacterium]